MQSHAHTYQFYSIMTIIDSIKVFPKASIYYISAATCGKISIKKDLLLFFGKMSPLTNSFWFLVEIAVVFLCTESYPTVPDIQKNEAGIAGFYQMGGMIYPKSVIRHTHGLNLIYIYFYNEKIYIVESHNL